MHLADTRRTPAALRPRMALKVLDELALCSIVSAFYDAFRSSGLRMRGEAVLHCDQG